MKKLVILGFMLFSFALYAQTEPSAKICKIMSDAMSKKYSPKELCDRFDGSFCFSIKTTGQAVCAANNGHFCDSYKSEGEAICEGVNGHFCSSIKSWAGGICSILGGSFCSDENDLAKWKRKLAKACNWD